VRDIINDASAMTELTRIGVLTTPVTVIDGEVVGGFDRQKLERLLAA
jgi:glutaredoxin